MNIKTFGIFLFILIASVQVIFGQTDKEKALSLGTEAVKLMDNGKIEESIKLLEEAKSLDPDSQVYSYEIACAYYLKKDYNKSIDILQEISDYKDFGERYFQLLGNCFDNIGNSDKAFETYDAGLKKYPESGILYLEKGNVYWDKKDYDKALPFYEKGIELDPAFPSNYYRAALIYCNSTEAVWGMIYGELFMNLERNSERTEEISKLLYDTYKNRIKISLDNKYSVSFSQSININPDDGGKINIFGNFVYETVLAMSVVGEKTIDMNSLDKIRTKFVTFYYQNNNSASYPNVLFDYQKELLNKGYMECYNHWILMKGDEDAFGKWYDSNSGKWKEFVNWFSKNGLEINKSNKFSRMQYNK